MDKELKNLLNLRLLFITEFVRFNRLIYIFYYNYVCIIIFIFFNIGLYSILFIHTRTHLVNILLLYGLQVQRKYVKHKTISCKNNSRNKYYYFFLVLSVNILQHRFAIYIVLN